MRNRSLSPATRAAQALRMIDEVTGAVVPPLDLSSTYARDADYALRQGNIYGREGGPTLAHAEAVLASLDGAEAALGFASGMSAAVALFETLRAGDHVVAPEVMYHGVVGWLMRMAELRGLKVDLVDASQPGALEAAIRPGQTRLVWAETPANPSWDVVDIGAVAAATHAAGARLAVDCTAAPPCTQLALALGADYAFQSGTKYLGGHSDLTAGVLSTNLVDETWAEVATVRKLMGTILSPFPAWLMVRGMRTLFLRYERASENALALAEWLEGHPGISKVLYPGLPSHPGYEVAKRQMTGGFGGMLSVLVKGTVEQTCDVVRFCEVFVPATSLGGVESLIEHRKVVEGPFSVVPETLIRISTGIEDIDDLRADLAQALERAL